MIQHVKQMKQYPRQWQNLAEHELVELWRTNANVISSYREGGEELAIGGAALAGQFDATGFSKTQNIQNPTGYVVVDYDDIGDTEVAEALRDLVGRSEFTRIACISKSGDGVHIVVKVGKNPDILRQSWFSVVAAVIRYYDDLTGYKADRQGSGLSRVIFDTHDPDLIYRPNAVFPLAVNTVYNGEERKLNRFAELNDSMWPRVFGSAYSLVQNDIKEYGRIRHETVCLSLLPISGEYAASMVEFLTDSRTGNESWGVDELETLSKAGDGPLGIGSVIHAASAYTNLRVDAEAWLAEKGWDLKVQFDRDVPWTHVMSFWESKINAVYNADGLPQLVRDEANGLRWTDRFRRVELGDMYKVFGATAQYRMNMNMDANPPVDLIRMCERWTYETLPEVDRVTTTARVIDGQFYGEDAYIPSHKLLVKPERKLKELMSVDEAMTVWDDYCGQFAFASQHDRENLLLQHMSPLLRNEAYGWAILLVTKPNKSVGGTKALQSGWYGLHTSGFSSPSVPMSRTLGSRMIDTVLASEKSEVYLDNIYTLNYVTLKNVPVNAEVTVDPKMQRAHVISTRNLTVFADGINVSLDSEMQRRVLLVRLTEESALRNRANGYRHSVIIRDIQQNQDFTDALLSLAYHYTQTERTRHLTRYIDSLEEFTEVAYTVIQMCFGDSSAEEWLDAQLQETVDQSDGEEDLGVISALQLGWIQVFDEGKREVRARDLLHWVKTQAQEEVETFGLPDYDTPANLKSDTTDIIDLLKRGAATSLNEFVWQLKDAENRLFEVAENTFAKLVLTHRKGGTKRGTWCSLDTVMVAEEVRDY